MNPWHRSVHEVADALATDTARGLSTASAVDRARRDGPNALPARGEPSLLRVLVRQFASPLIYLLFAAAGIAVALGERGDAAVIVVVVVLNAVIGTIQEGRAARSLRALRSFSTRSARVVRDGHLATIDSRDLVTGDVLEVEAGDAVTADARIVEASALKVAEAALTGESVPVDKHADVIAEDAPLAERSNMLYAGTFVTAGRARAIVTQIGTNTEIGRIARLAEETGHAKTPLEARVAQFGRFILVAAFVMLFVLLAVGLARGMRLGEILMISISQLVGMVPEGLPVAMTIALAVGVQRMARQRAIVRQLSAVETLGSTTVICTDKTGTLTKNEMMVAAVVLADGSELRVSGSGYAETGSIEPPRGDGLAELLRACVLCNDAHLDAGETPLGDPTEIALLVLARKGGLDPDEVRTAYPRRGELPFDSSAKMMATEHTGAGGPFVVIKGAPEVIVEHCAGAPSWVRASADALATRALRVLAFAVIDGELGTGGFAALGRRARFIGLVGQIDPPRAEAAVAVARCRAAGIRPVMITGDHPATGLAIARTLDIARDGDGVLDGKSLARLPEDELAARIATVSVFARVHPEQKLRIVRALQDRGEVVAMTGDGVNDAPALVKADVGVAMGKSGTEVAKEAAKIVIADDNFATIVSAVEQGRVAYRNIKKAILLLFSTSLAEVLVLLAAMVLGYPAPFAAVQILWNNLVTEGLITVNLVLEPPEGDEMTRPPIARSEPLLSRALLLRMAALVPTIVGVTLGWFVMRTQAGIPVAQVRTETFTLLVVCEWFAVLACRSATASAFKRSLLRNRWLLGGLVAANLLQVAAVFFGPLSDTLHTVPFDLDIVVELGLVGSIVLWVEEIRKWFVRRRAHR